MGECDQATAESIMDCFYEQVSLTSFSFLSFLASFNGPCNTQLTDNPGRLVKAILRNFPLHFHADHYAGNFFDTANNYQYQETETWIGEWMKKRGNRDELGRFDWNSMKAELVL